jgi:hypothetical protein
MLPLPHVGIRTAGHVRQGWMSTRIHLPKLLTTWQIDARWSKNKSAWRFPQLLPEFWISRVSNLCCQRLYPLSARDFQNRPWRDPTMLHPFKLFCLIRSRSTGFPTCDCLQPCAILGTQGVPIKVLALVLRIQDREQKISVFQIGAYFLFSPSFFPCRNCADASAIQAKAHALVDQS